MKRIFFFSFFVITILIGNKSFAQSITVNGETPACGSSSGSITVTTGYTVNRWEVGYLNGNGYFISEGTIASLSKTISYDLTATSLTGDLIKTYRVYLNTGGGGTTYTQTTIEVYEQPEAGSLSYSGTNAFQDSGTINIELSGNIGSVTWEKSINQYRDYTTVTPDANSGNIYSFNVTEKTYFRTKKVNNECISTSNVVLANVYKIGTLTGPSEVTEENRATLNLEGHNGTVIRWEYSTDDGATWVRKSSPEIDYRHRISQSMKFRVYVNLGPFGNYYSNIFEVEMIPYLNQPGNAFPTFGGNYTKEQTVNVEGITNPANVNGLSAGNKQEVTTYFDASGHAVQTNIRQGSPDLQDMVIGAFYDEQGRKTRTYLPYKSTSTDGSYRGEFIDGAYRDLFLEEFNSYYYATAEAVNDKVAVGGSLNSGTRFEKSPLGRVIATSSPNITTISNPYIYDANLAGEVRKFNTNGSSSSFYPANSLSKTETSEIVTSPSVRENMRQVFVDKAGRTIMTRVQLEETINGVSVPWLETYYIYNHDGSLKYKISPKGVAALKTSSWSFTSAFKNQYVFQYIHDSRGRLIEEKVPGKEAWNYYCYDRLDRLVLSQDGHLKAQNKWYFYKYDKKGRVVKEGIYTNTSSTTRASVQQYVIDPLYSDETEPYFEESPSTNFSFPTSQTEDLVKNFYDGYHDSFTPQGLSGESKLGSPKGMLTRTDSKIMGTETWLLKYYYYNTDGQLIQLRSNNHKVQETNDLQTFVYDFSGKVKLTKVTHDGGTGSTITVRNRLKYDHLGRLQEVYQKNNNDPEILLAYYVYNPLGQLVEKNLHVKVDPLANDPGVVNEDIITRGSYNSAEKALVAQQEVRLTDGFEVPAGSTFTARTAQGTFDIKDPTEYLQSVDYRFHVNGQIASINNASLEANGSDNDDTNDYFGMEFSTLFNGNISSVKWKGPAKDAGAIDQRKYDYTYDNANRLKSTVSAMNDGSTWTKETGVFNENVKYDHNGNILELQRKRRNYNGSGYAAATMDNLTYTYKSSMGDQLQKVEDASSDSQGFDNGVNVSTEYLYDNDGNLQEDKNKGISSIVYNDLGKPEEMLFSDGRLIEYDYDANGTKLSMRVYEGGSASPQKTTDYLGGFVYENDALSFFSSPEGRVVKNGNAFEYQYALTDNQGNTRVLFSAETPEPMVAFADFEASSNSDFENYPEGGSRSSVKLFNHTSGSSSTYSQMLNAGVNLQVGINTAFKVYPGDVVNVEAYAKYYDPKTTTSNLSGFATALTSAFNLTGDLAGEAALAYDALFDYGSLIAAGGGPGDDDLPKAFVNVILFDKDFNFLGVSYDQISGGEQTDAGSTPHDLMSTEITVEEAGYAFVYISNEDPKHVEVYFDDVKVTHTPTNIIQYNEYYAFGLQAGSSWTRENTSNNFLYNQGTELNQTSGYYETPLRLYDPALGRFTGIDVLAGAYPGSSPYHYASNNPVMFNDPTGAYTNGTEQARPMNGGYPYGDDWMGRPTGPGMAGSSYYDNYSTNMFHGAYNNAPDAMYSLRSMSAAIPSAAERNAQRAVSEHFGGINLTPGVSYSFTVDYDVQAINRRVVIANGAPAIANDGYTVRESYGVRAQNGGMTDFSNSNLALTVGGGIYGAMEGATAGEGYWVGKNGKYYTNMTGRGPNQYTGSRTAALKAANRYKLAGRATVFISAGIGVYSTIEGIQQDGGEFGYNAQMAAVGSAGGMVGGIAGAKAGAAIGAGIGVLFGGVGAVPGAVIGGFIGGIGGGLLGGYAGESAVNYYHDR